MKLRKDKTGFNKNKRWTELLGSSEAMSKSKKNVIDPEEMIQNYGANSVRWFILSDSPLKKNSG